MYYSQDKNIFLNKKTISKHFHEIKKKKKRNEMYYCNINDKNVQELRNNFEIVLFNLQYAYKKE